MLHDCYGSLCLTKSKALPVFRCSFALETTSPPRPVFELVRNQSGYDLWLGIVIVLVKTGHSSSESALGVLRDKVRPCIRKAAPVSLKGGNVRCSHGYGLLKGSPSKKQLLPLKEVEISEHQREKGESSVLELLADWLCQTGMTYSRNVTYPCRPAYM